MVDNLIRSIKETVRNKRPQEGEHTGARQNWEQYVKQKIELDKIMGWALIASTGQWPPGSLTEAKTGTDSHWQWFAHWKYWLKSLNFTEIGTEKI